jgi:glycogen debranching enzyme
MEEAYEPLCRWTDWWFTYRDDDGDGVPQYNHGNESGWDNSTVFSTLPPIESPDLSAWLVLQMEMLAEMAGRLGHDGEAIEWAARSRRLLVQMLDHFWQEDHFVARKSGSHEVIESDSLLLYMPIILGKRLPAAVQAALVDGIKAGRRFLTDFGPATERISSPYLTADGYWRGPIWGAPTLLLVDGLRALGEEKLAADISRRFCDMVAENGIAENYDPLTGQGLRERAFTWTASAFLILASELPSDNHWHAD